MDLIFTQSETGKSWVAEFEATADFNLHIERDKGGNLMLYQRTNGGGWDIVNDFANPRFGAIDYDCAALIYPKFVKVVSEVEPTYAAVTSAGEVTEIKSQDKSVEVTSNGTIDVTPDAGFAYLNSVKVKTNVAQSGEGGGGSTGGGGSASSWRYFDTKGFIDDKSQLKVISPFLVKTNERINAAVNCKDWSSVIAIGVDAKSKFAYNGDVYTWEETMIADGFMEMLPTMGVIEITEEEFYNLNA